MSTFSWEFLCVNTKPLINSAKCRNEVADTKNQWVSEKDISNMAVWQNKFSWMFSWLFVLELFKNHFDLTIKKSWLLTSLDLQSVITVTFEVPGNAKEESLNVFIQVNAIFDWLLICQLFCYIALAMVGLTKIYPLIQNLLWEKNVRNKDDDCMEVIRLKVQYMVYSFILLDKVPFLTVNINHTWS